MPQGSRPQWRRCQCRKSLYIREKGKTVYVSAKTRSWEEAERVAQRERDRRDPVKIALAQFADAEAAKAEAAKAKEKPFDEALQQWLAGMKAQTRSSLDAYRSDVTKIGKWATAIGFRTVEDVTPDMLDAWRSSWSPGSEVPELRLALNTQSALLTRVQAFFKWATGMEYTHRNPALFLKAITTDESQTQPLTQTQFDS